MATLMATSIAGLEGPVGFIGCGRLGCTLAYVLARAGVPVFLGSRDGLCLSLSFSLSIDHTNITHTHFISLLSLFLFAFLYIF